MNVVYDSVGKDTFDRSLECLAPLGMLVSFGQSSGFPAPLDIQRLGGMRSAFVTRPSVFAYVQEREKYLAYARAVFDMAAAGDAHAAHRRRLSPGPGRGSAHRAGGPGDDGEAGAGTLTRTSRAKTLTTKARSHQVEGVISPCFFVSWCLCGEILSNKELS